MPAIWVILVILWGVFSAVGKTAQRKKSNQPAISRPASQPSAAPKPAPPPPAFRDDEDEEDGWETKPAPPPPPPARKKFSSPAPARPAHVSTPLEAHMHTPVMGMEGHGTEGIDCCHDYMLGGAAPEEPADFLPMREEEQQERAKALLQGVIYSEILGRRPMRRYNVKHTRGET